MIAASLAVAMTLSEPLRPQFHFTAPQGWLNDPNGLVYYKRRYHMFYQHNPKGTNWGNMTWGHAVSTDLLHWKDLPEAIEPDHLGTIFSGSAVVDSQNTAGFGAGALVCFYTAAGGTNQESKGMPFTQCLAHSIDGVHFSKFDNNPVIPHQIEENRDPKVVWDQEHKKWVLALYLHGGTYALFGSSNLTHWEKLSEVPFPGTDECPDFFQIPLAGSGDKKWIFTGANCRYMVGSFDGTTFHPETGGLPTNFGNTCYAAQTYSNEPKGDRIQIAWMRDSNFAGTAWNQQMALPTKLTLHAEPEGPRLRIEPVKGIETLRVKKVSLNGGSAVVASGLIDFAGTWAVPESGTLKIKVNGAEIQVDARSQKLSALNHDAALDLGSGTLAMRIIADVTTIEIFAQAGKTWMPLFRLPKEDDFKGVKIESDQWKGSVRIYELSGVWTGSRSVYPSIPSK